jgi:hypothetical protein
MNSQHSTNSSQSGDPSGTDWDTIYTYTRAQAIADGFQIEVTKTAQEAGPLFAERTSHLGHPSCGGLGKPIRVFIRDIGSGLWYSIPVRVS